MEGFFLGDEFVGGGERRCAGGEVKVDKEWFVGYRWLFGGEAIENRVEFLDTSSKDVDLCVSLEQRFLCWMRIVSISERGNKETYGCMIPDPAVSARDGAHLARHIGHILCRPLRLGRERFAENLEVHVDQYKETKPPKGRTSA